MANNEYRHIARLARPYYNAEGPNSWEHIQEVRRRAQRMMRRLEGRGLTPAEYAAVMLHDSTKRDMGGKDHGRTGAARAAELLAAALPKRQAAEAVEAIAVHDDNLAEFPSHTAELLASADANPPDIDWSLNKSYNWNLLHGLSDDKSSAEHMAETMPKKYGVGGTFNVPGIYAKYYGDKVREAQEYYSSASPEDMLRRVLEYRARSGIRPGEARMLHNV